MANKGDERFSKKSKTEEAAQSKNFAATDKATDNEIGTFDMLKVNGWTQRNTTVLYKTTVTVFSLIYVFSLKIVEAEAKRG